MGQLIRNIKHNVRASLNKMGRTSRYGLFAMVWLFSFMLFSIMIWTPFNSMVLAPMLYESLSRQAAAYISLIVMLSPIIIGFVGAGIFALIGHFGGPPVEETS